MQPVQEAAGGDDLDAFVASAEQLSARVEEATRNGDVPPPLPPPPVALPPIDPPDGLPSGAGPDGSVLVPPPPQLEDPPDIGAVPPPAIVGEPSPGGPATGEDLDAFVASAQRLSARAEAVARAEEVEEAEESAPPDAVDGPLTSGADAAVPEPRRDTGGSVGPDRSSDRSGDRSADGSADGQWTPIRREALLAPADDPSYGGAVPPELPPEAVPGSGSPGGSGKVDDRLSDREGSDGTPFVSREVMVPGDDVSLDLLERARSMLDEGTRHLMAVPGSDGPTDHGGDDGAGRPPLPQREPGAALEAEFVAAFAGESATPERHADGHSQDRDPDRDEELVFVGGPAGPGDHEHQGGHPQHVDTTPPRGHDPAGAGLMENETERRDGNSG